MSGRFAAAAGLLALAAAAFALALGMYRRMTAAPPGGGVLAVEDAGKLALSLAAIGVACVAISAMVWTSARGRGKAGSGEHDRHMGGGRPAGDADGARDADRQVDAGGDPLMD